MWSNHLDPDGSPPRPALRAGAGELEIRRVHRTGRSLAVTLPAHFARRLGFDVGALVAFSVGADGALRLRNHARQDAGEPSGMTYGARLRDLLRSIARLRRRAERAYISGYHAGQNDGRARAAFDADRELTALRASLVAAVTRPSTN